MSFGAYFDRCNGMSERHYTPVDRLITIGDSALRTVFGRPASTRTSPAASVTDTSEQEADSRQAEAMMRVNHAGEICAQALYQGQALTARDARVRESIQQAVQEENDHLAWCAQRIDELGTYKSRLNPLWYTGSFAIGTAFGLLGDRWSLGFLAETERQVVKHLEGHLARLPAADAKSRAIVKTMRDDEARHATAAVRAGAAELPGVVKGLMAATARIMTTAAARW
jgi:ubiquinone biosynthesis monooxygenase Coq7